MAHRFTKMHGLGNDFVVIDARETPVDMTAARAAAIADRQRGIGCDQLVLLEHSVAADIKMRIFNSDGSEVEACGNATRCVASLLGVPATIETLGGMLNVTPADGGAKVVLVEPRFDWDQIPLAYPMDSRDLPLAWDELEHGAVVNVGNPHVVFFVPDSDAVPLHDLGPRIETDSVFPQKINVNVASLVGDNHVKLRVWERGVGLTQACGTGACATAVAGIRAGLVQSPVTISLPGGDLTIEWTHGAPIIMTGPATRVFEGETDWAHFG